MIEDDDDYQNTNHKNCSTSDNNIIINNNVQQKQMYPSRKQHKRIKNQVKIILIIQIHKKEKGF
ncbi:hypothetical protein Dsin_001207 [Dipteronia sinensis]|uniref:Uncharacterized protein n=1 Tax=Dipteronia sinensis TaxID=43782 RepID=A0AAE0EI82_9ROSI|nr:hypothetical protein Dsin_001207 [Dipteronia sinensis]